MFCIFIITIQFVHVLFMFWLHPSIITINNINMIYCDDSWMQSKHIQKIIKLNCDDEHAKQINLFISSVGGGNGCKVENWKQNFYFELVSEKTKHFLQRSFCSGIQLYGSMDPKIHILDVKIKIPFNTYFSLTNRHDAHWRSCFCKFCLWYLNSTSQKTYFHRVSVTLVSWKKSSWTL